MSGVNLKWISVNPTLKEGVQLLNSLSAKKFHLLLNHIITEEQFTDEELAKLKDSLKLTEEQVELLVQSIVHILKQSNRILIKPTDLQKQLCESLEFDEEKAEDFVKVWSKQVNDNVDFENRKCLEDISWEMNIQGADQIDNRQYEPLARLQFRVSKGDTGESSKEKLTFELNKEELIHLYNTLESIQLKVDSLKK
ncbi:unnamed protein product [Acanthoscelides obtectus]|uniref:COMM domain-containing protein n=1 Tax=Acanthoscelides obtectus TaxID=200917 RepID=A0A9P0JW07_ACAOB|nr:unnamed protein product [Acanthoscelides obtectus]CAK1666108.1 COMM domain-containing protein 10 [Acanthoscelides obtectus]